LIALRRSRSAAAAALTGSAFASLLFPAAAPAHSALVGKQDLPIPEWLFAWGASLVLIVSFVALTLAWRTALLEDDHWRPAPRWLSGAIVNPLTIGLAGAAGVFLLGVVIWSGLEGTTAPPQNFAPTFVFVTFWLGLVFLSVLLGDVFRAFNPWRAIANAISWVFRFIARQDAPSPLAYPQRLGRWPAVAGLLGFLWFELIYSAGGTEGLSTSELAVAAMAYTVITFVGMALFGIEAWLRQGETFSVYFGMFATLAPIEVRDGRLGVRRALSASTKWAVVPGSVAVVMVALGGTVFDGAQEGLLKEPIEWLFETVQDLGADPSLATRIANSAFLLLSVGFVAGVYWLGIRGMKSVRGTDLSVGQLGRIFVHSFIPIALAYLVAHYFTYFLWLEQGQFTYLLTDPLGDGSNIFGISKDPIDYGLIGANAVWYVQVAALIVGHVTALALAHDKAVALYRDARAAARSQYWMLALMVGFTSLGLFLLSQANQ
jgi:hypothetical protein